MNEQLIEQGKQMIMDALTEYNLFKISEIYIQHREDVEEEQLSYYVYLRMSSMERSQVLSVSLSPVVSVNVL